MTFFNAKRKMDIHVLCRFNTFVKNFCYLLQRNFVCFMHNLSQELNYTSKNVFQYLDDCIIQLILIQIMHSSDVEALNTMQEYLASLFDQMQPIPLQTDISDQQILAQTNSKIIQIALTYGKKILQLSQQCTYKYRNERFLPRSQIEQQISRLYKLICDQQPQGSYQKMIRILLEKGQQQRKSIWMRYALPESRLTQTQTKSELKNQQQKMLQGSVMKQSKVATKPKVSKPSVKQVLQIKGYFQSQENHLRELFQKVSKMLQNSKVSLGNMDSSMLKYSRIKGQNVSDKITSLVKSNIDSNVYNILNLTKSVEFLHQVMQKRLKKQGQSQSKLSLFMQQTQRIEQLHSYSISKVLESLVQLKKIASSDPSLCQAQIRRTQQMIQKLYNTFPNKETLHQNVSYSNQHSEGVRNYGVQVSLTNKTQPQRKPGSDAYRVQVRVSQVLDKFQRFNQHKKTIEIKEANKLLQNIREMLTIKPISSVQVAFSQEYARLAFQKEKVQKQVEDVYLKKNKKLQKRNEQLQKTLIQVKKEAQELHQKWDKQRKKAIKRAETAQNDLKQLDKQKKLLQKNLTECLRDVDKLRSVVRRKGQEQTQRFEVLEQDRRKQKQKSQSALIKLNQAAEEFKVQRGRLLEQRQLFKQKIVMVQTQLDEERELNASLKLEIEQAITQNSKLHQQINSMTKIYEQKIHQVQEMINNIGQLQNIKNKQKNHIQSLKQQVQKQQQNNLNLQNTIKDQNKKIQEMTKTQKLLKQEAQKRIQQGQLTQADLKVLKDQIQKVSNAYIETQALLQTTKQELRQTQQERQRFFKEKLKLGRIIEELQGQHLANKTKQQALELSQRDMREQHYQKNQQLVHLQREFQDLKRQGQRMRKQLGQQRQGRAKNDKQLRDLRQQLQSRRELDSAQTGRRKLQLQNLRVDLRRSGQQLQKQRLSYEQRLGIATQRIRQMQQCLSQKEILSQLMGHKSG